MPLYRITFIIEQYAYCISRIVKNQILGQMTHKIASGKRGQVGIGTLIVFIALVLVATIASGVLINTAEFLQTQSEETGQESTAQVADNINIIGQVGAVAKINETTDDDSPSELVLYELRLIVQRSPGSDDIDLTELSIQYIGDQSYAQLEHVTEANNTYMGVPSNEIHPITDMSTRGEPAYLVEPITAESPDDAVLTDDADRYEIIIPLATANDTSETAIYDDETFDDWLISRYYLNDSLDGEGVGSLTYSDVEADPDALAGSPDRLKFDNVYLHLLEEGESAELKITTNTGSSRQVMISVPDTLVNKGGTGVTV
jgi:flagellin FlaB